MIIDLSLFVVSSVEFDMLVNIIVQCFISAHCRSLCKTIANVRFIFVVGICVPWFSVATFNDDLLRCCVQCVQAVLRT
jgi:hypothetical protein